MEVNPEQCTDDEKRIGKSIIAYLRHEADNDVRDGAVGWCVFREAMDKSVLAQD